MGSFKVGKLTKSKCSCKIVVPIQMYVNLSLSVVKPLMHIVVEAIIWWAGRMWGVSRWGEVEGGKSLSKTVQKSFSVKTWTS